MSVENKRMQQRYGTYSQFQNDKSNLLPNEFASVTADDPNTASGKALYFNPESGEPYRLLTNEDKTELDADIEQVEQTAETTEETVGNLQNAMNSLQSTVNQHTTQIGNLNTQVDEKIEQSDLEEYAYSKSEVNTAISMALSNYYTSYTINDMLSFGSGTIPNQVLAGDLNYFWVKLGFKISGNQRVSGICLMVIDSPICTGNDRSITVTLPFITAETIQIPIMVGTTQRLYTVSEGSNSLEISGINGGDRLTGMFAYRIGVAVG